MSELVLVLFDDEQARDWTPFALTRPAGELLFGTMTLRERAERAFGARCVGHLTAPHLRGFEEAGAPPVVSEGDLAQDQDRLFLLSRFVPESPVSTQGWSEGPLTAGAATVGWFAPAGRPAPPDEFWLGPATPRSEARPTVEGFVLERVWHLVTRNPDRIALDIAARFPDAGAPNLTPGAHHWGDHPLILDPSARIEPGSAFDTSHGPIWIDRGATVRATTRLAGPAYVGSGSILLGGPIEAVSIGPVCRVRGELAESVCVGYVNKQHDGHMGHAYLGRWVNLGAETTNSDLKNNYGTIRIGGPAGEVETGEIKMGSLIGDHVKTGIGLLLNTGTVVGAGSNLYGSAMPPKYVPPFSWGTGHELIEYRLEAFLEVAERAMGRRNVVLTDGLRAQLSRAWEMGRAHAGLPDAKPGKAKS